MTRTVDLVIPNMAEYFLRNPALTLTGEERARAVRFGGTYESEHSAFWTQEDRVLMLPEGYDPLWFADMHEVLGLTPPPVVSPRARSGLLVADLLSDGDAQALLRGHLTGADTVRVFTFGPTPDVYRLRETMRGWGLQVELDCVDEEAYWASLYLDSKISPLDLARRLPEVRVADGMTVSNPEELEGALAVMLQRHGTAIVRCLHGVAGDGTAVVRAGENAVADFMTTFESDSFFVFPLLVQRFVEHHREVGCPAVDLYVDDDGVRDIVLCALTVEDGHLFRSVNIGPGALPAVWAQRVTALAHELGNAARELGYRGWMCVDCVAGADEKIYVTEINARRSGSMLGGQLLRMWGAQDRWTLSAHFMMPVPPGTSYERDIRPIFQELWKEGAQVYPTTVRGIAWPEPIMAVLAAGETAAEAEKLVERVYARVRTIGVGDDATSLAGSPVLSELGPVH